MMELWNKSQMASLPVAPFAYHTYHTAPPRGVPSVPHGCGSIQLRNDSKIPGQIYVFYLANLTNGELLQ